MVSLYGLAGLGCRVWAGAGDPRSDYKGQVTVVMHIQELEKCCELTVVKLW